MNEVERMPTAIETLRQPWSEPGFFVRGFRSTAAMLVRGWLRAYERLTIVGRQHLPTERSFILVANHASHLDTLCLLSALPIRQLHRSFPIAAADYFCVNPWRALLAKLIVNVLPFERCLVPWQSLSLCADLLREPGTVLIVFPEGTRNNDREPGVFKPGVGLLAAGRDIPVVPCHLEGTRDSLPRGAWWPRPNAVRLAIGPPRTFAHLPPTKASRTHVCRELRDAVVSLATSQAYSEAP
jgi:1-acyl-sn-glycerol-3-phosphate acyltransferase